MEIEDWRGACGARVMNRVQWRCTSEGSDTRWRDVQVAHCQTHMHLRALCMSIASIDSSIRRELLSLRAASVSCLLSHCFSDCVFSHFLEKLLLFPTLFSCALNGLLTLRGSSVLEAGLSASFSDNRRTKQSWTCRSLVRTLAWSCREGRKGAT